MAETAPLKRRISRKVTGVNRANDITLGWVEHEYPQLAAWRALAVEWMKGEIQGISSRLSALAVFFEKFLVQRGLPLDPAVFLSRGTILPDFYQTGCPQSKHGIGYNNYIHTFLNFVLLLKFSAPANDG